MRVIVAEDDLTSRLMLSSMIGKWGFEVASCEDGREAMASLEELPEPCIAVLDWEMPHMDGVEVVRRLRRVPALRPRYLILLTGRDNKKDIIAGLNAGADDYPLAKPYDSDELRARLRVGQRVVELQTALADRVCELERVNAIIANMANEDELTGLANRRLFNEMFVRDLAAARRHGHPLSLVMADLDRFKHVNDTFGHDAGDRVLRTFAGLLKQASRKEDLPARWGGEEFAVLLLPETSPTGASLFAERMRTEFEESLHDGLEWRFTASFGVAGLGPGGSGDDLLRCADEALLQAKRSGRNCVVAASRTESVLDVGSVSR